MNGQMNELNIANKDETTGPNEMLLVTSEVSEKTSSFSNCRNADSSTPRPQAITVEKEPYLYCQPLALPPRLLPLLLFPPPQLLLLLLLFGVTAVARPSSLPSLSETFIVDTGSPPCILTPRSICPSWAGENNSVIL